MRIPKFIPLVESERRKREIVGLLIQALMWGYSIVILVRVIWFTLIMRQIEDATFDTPPQTWAVKIIEFFSYDSRDFVFGWPLIFGLFIGGALLGIAIGFTGKGFGAWIASISKIQVNNPPEDSIRIEKHWSYARKEGWFFFVLTLITGWLVTKIDLFKLVEADGVKGAKNLVAQLACGIPGVGHLPIFTSCTPTTLSYFGFALEKLSESIYLAFMATILAIPVAFILSFFAARNLTRHSAPMRAAYVLVRMYINITRSIEPLIWAILFSVWIGIGPFAGSIALMVHSVSSLVKQYSEAVEGVDAGPLEALQATGASRVATVWFAVVPQVMLPYMAFTIYRWDINVRMATVIGLVGGGGIGGILIQEQGLAHWPAVGSIAFLIFVVVWGMDFLSAKIREAIQ